MKIKAVFNRDTNEIVAWEFHCHGCKHLHVYYTVPFYDQPVWIYNHNPKSPTFSPSLLNTKPSGERCHLFVENGYIKYCGDCTHELAGQTVEMDAITVNI